MVWTLEDEKCLGKPGWKRKATPREEKHKHRHLTIRLIHTQCTAHGPGQWRSKSMRGKWEEVWD